MNNIGDYCSSSKAEIFCLGLNEETIGIDGPAPLLSWALWECNKDLILTPGSALPRPLYITEARWTTLVYFRLHGGEFLKDVYLSALKFIRPGDYVIFLVSTEKRISVGDNRDTRFDFGHRLEWSTEPPTKNHPFNAHDADLELIVSEAQDLLLLSRVDGTVRVERDVSTTTTAQLLCRISTEEKVDLMVIKANLVNKDMIIECAKGTPCTLGITK